ncbi:MAG: hypothetical protein Q9178_001072 [Gyalolechia marmorata]
MAKLNRIIDSDDDFPELSTIITQSSLLSQRQAARIQEPNSGLKPNTRTSVEKREGEKQRPLKPSHADSILLSLASRGTSSTNSSKGKSGLNARRLVKCSSKAASLMSSFSFPTGSDDLSSDHMSDFIIDDSDSEDGEEGPEYSTRRCLPSGTRYCPDKMNTLSAPRSPLRRREKTSFSNKPRNIFEGQNLDEGKPIKHDDDFEGPNPIPKFSPPRLRSPTRSPPLSRVVTPPKSPARLKLPSPTKKHHIPPSPHRPSVDAFWSQEVINDWNDSYTPGKPAKSSHSREPNGLREADEGYLSPCQTGRISPSKGPIEADKQAAERRKAFNKKKYELAAAFLKEIDQTIVNGQVTKLTEPTGGVRLVWSKKLQSTAGRAIWRREAIRTNAEEGQVSATKYRHHASIELAEKVIDDEDRLINVVAHEYCHLLNFMISNIKDSPHGKEFKIWAKKCTAAFAHRGVNVTTTHVYEISYKYIWACSKCGVEYKRHSKSIDPARHLCGKCREKLIQVKPKPRGEGKGASEYQEFVKANFARLKREKPGMSMGEVMAALGKEFREAKEKRKDEVVVPVDEVPKVGGRRADENADLESVMRKLDFLELGMD